MKDLQSQLEAKKAERAALETSHTQLVEAAKVQQQQFNQQVAVNQQRFHELSGAIAVLQDLANATTLPPLELTPEETGDAPPVNTNG